MSDAHLHDAASWGDVDKARELLKHGRDDVNCRNHGRTPLHCACSSGRVDMVRMLISEFQADTTLQDEWGYTPLHDAALCGSGEVALTLITEFGCDANLPINNNGYTSLHKACAYGHASVVRMIGKYASLLATDKNGDTPLHIAAARGHKECVEALLQLDAPTMLRNAAGKTALHLALEGGRSSIMRIFVIHVSALATTKDGDTPLHIAAAGGHDECVEALLQLDPPIMLRNAAGKTARDIARYGAEQLLDAYITQNKAKLYAHYDIIMQQAKKKYSNAERITRVFIIGNPGAGKSSFVEAMKREDFFESFGRVSESTVPLHTAGIIPSIHTSKCYGRVLFYDFAGDPEYYSSHAAILENLASSKGDNIFIIVVNLKDDILAVRNTLHYLLSFIDYQCGSKNLIAIGSHSDLLPKETADKKIQKISAIHVDMDYFTLNCCKPRSKEFEDIKRKIVQLTKDSPRYKLSTEASVLLGLLEKDFSNVTACSVRTILSSIVETGISLPKNITSLMALMRELHDVGILFVIGDERCDNPQIILNISKLTNEVHKLLFSKEPEFLETEEAISSFNIGILPQSLLNKLLPQHITKECLIQLQYCQEISQHDLVAFPSLSKPDTSSHSFLFFPSLCTVGKSDVSWVTPPGLGYSIVWLARCANTACDYFPPRFLHVLLLRLIFRFTLIVPAQHQTDTSASPDHSHLKRRCTMWNCGIHWSLVQGVDCMVELVNGNKGVVVITSSIHKAKQNCIDVFKHVVNCVMEAKEDFCHSFQPQFFLFDPSQSADYLNEDGLFAMSDVESVLSLPSHEGQVVLSINGKRSLIRERIACLSKFTLWNSLFSLDVASVNHYLEEVVTEIYELFIHLGLPKCLLDTIEVNFRDNVNRRRIELVDTWISSSSPDPPCWWQLVQALKKVKYGRLAQELETQYSECVVYSCTNIH